MKSLRIVDLSTAAARVSAGELVVTGQPAVVVTGELVAAGTEKRHT